MTKESQIETSLINKLKDLKYTYRPDIHDRETLEQNFREKFQALNSVKFTDAEFARLHDEIVNTDVFTAACALRQRNTFQREDGTPLHYTLVNTKQWCKNDFEVINQLRINTANSHQRYDVIVLINGLPVVQIELKSLGLNPRRAMEQIVNYKNDAGNGYTNTLLCFMQLFIVSNESDTLYFANNANKYFSFNAKERFLPIYQLACEKNIKITNLYDFAEKFLPKCTLGEIISHYMVLVASEKKLMIMRPYQIYAVKAIVDCIDQNRGNGYVWHTTGSGKTLTSFKASTLLKDNPDIDKCLFVVDRKDLDHQTREEFNKFQQNCVEENTNTETLVRRLLSDDYADKVIVATIQKLGLALDGAHHRNYKKRLEPLRNQRIVFIFDECHRSQFGENHKAIKEFFPNAQLFGFTGTPIFEANASSQKIEDEQTSYQTTKSIFQQQLHAYTITHAIEDGNVLRFHIDYFCSEDKAESKDTPKPQQKPTKQQVIPAILAKHNDATGQRRFNALLATASINDAIAYHRAFKDIQQTKQAEDPDFQPLNIACVFSPPAKGNKDVQQIQEDLPQEKADNKQAPEKKKAALEAIIADYNGQYSTNHSINEFDLYYKDVQQRIKNQEYANADYSHKDKIDLTIVVDMLLTGFDAQYLNTLYVDKNLKHHSLIQAFSRTNRVLNNTKPFGNILDFRAQQDAVDKAIVLFSNKQTTHAREIWLVEPASKVIKKLQNAVEDLRGFMAEQNLDCTPEQVPNIKGDAARGAFINHFKEVQRLKTQLDQYTDLNDQQKSKVSELLPEDQLNAFRGAYLETTQHLKVQQDKNDQHTNANEEIQQLDFELTLFDSVMIDYDYIMQLIARDSQKQPDKQSVSREQLHSLIRSNAKFMDMDESNDLIAYINQLPIGKRMDEAQIRQGYETFKATQSATVIATIATQHGLASETLQNFVDVILERMIFDGENLTKLVTPLGLHYKDRVEKELALMAELLPPIKKCANGRNISGLSAYE